MDFKVAAGTVIKEARQKKGMSQEHLSFYAKISTSSLSLIERGQNSPTLYTLFALARALNISAPELVKRIDKLEPEVDFVEPLG